MTLVYPQKYSTILASLTVRVKVTGDQGTKGGEAYLCCQRVGKLRIWMYGVIAVTVRVARNVM